MEQSSSLLGVFPVVVVSAEAGGRARAKRPLVYRSELMLMQLRCGRTPCAELVADGAHAALRAILPPRGETARHSSYRVTRLEGSVLFTRVLLPRKHGVQLFRMRVRHPDGIVDRLLPVEAEGPITEAAVAFRLRRGRTVLEIEGCGRIDVVF